MAENTQPTADEAEDVAVVIPVENELETVGDEVLPENDQQEVIITNNSSEEETTAVVSDENIQNTKSPMKNTVVSEESRQTTIHLNVEKKHRSPKGIKQRVREIKRAKQVIQQKMNSSSSESGVYLLLLVILALILPPLAVFIIDDISTRFWINLVLWLIGLGVGAIFFTGGLIWLCAVIAVIHALLIVLGII